ncbi:MAG: T9SS type A sorting domain-containing protein [Bacteroidetes bacterium]|nr:T9SS type A sorting domain-containing protein [Bacteroidota bacterium]
MLSNNKQYVCLFVFIALTTALISGFASSSGSTNAQTFSSPNLLDTLTLNANAGPSNNGGSSGWAMFFDLIGGTRDVTVTEMSTGSTATANGTFTVELFTRTGTSLGGPVGSGPGSSTDGWTSLGTTTFTQGSTANGVSLLCRIPPILVGAGDTVGVAAKFTGAGPRYYGTGTPPYNIYSDSNLTLITGDGRSAPFTPTGSWFASRAMVGALRYVVNPVSGIGVIGNVTPSDFKLSQNYPNPFNPVTTIEFAVPVRTYVVLSVYNSLGREAAVLVNGEYSPGNYRINWNASGLSSGVYFYTMRAGNFTQTKKLLLVK